MSQNMPPNTPQDGGNPNPYYQQQAPDLDASTPVLKDEEQQRLNRKAMFFLAGTLALVIAMAALVLTSGENEAPAVAEEPGPEVGVPACGN